jgi:hypothetical protein
MRTAQTILFLLFGFSLIGQDQFYIPRELSHQPAKRFLPLDGFEIFDRDQVNVPRRSSFLAEEDIIGITLYDLQTNNASQSRLVIGPDGRKAAAWMLSFQAPPNYPDRGTGFNEFDGSNWQSRPMARLEQNTRTGWPSLIQLGNGTYHITAHTSGTQLHSLTRSPGMDQWMESEVPNAIPGGVVWPRSAAGGSDGMTVHVIALSTPSFLGGAPYQGVNGHLLYYRSIDGGVTWDIQDQIIPGLDNTGYGFISADSYSLLASGDTVAIVVFGEWGDLAAWKSTDNGESWTKILINDFPLDAYQIDDGYTTADIPSDPLAPDSLAIYTSDGTGAAVLDEEGVLHVVWSDMYVLDGNTADGNSSFFPGWSGVTYWNENLAMPSFVGSFLDYDGNDTIDLTFANIPAYGQSTTSMPAMSIDAKGDIYVFYSMVSEAHFNELDQQNYRHIVGARSTDSGQTWGELYDIINPDLVNPDVVDFVEAVFPYAWPDADDRVHIVYQQDNFPGYTFQDSLDPLADNFIAYIGVPVSSFEGGMTSTRGQRESLEAKIYPSLVKDYITIELSETDFSDRIQMQIFTAMGQQIHHSCCLPKKSTFEMSSLPQGIYIISLTSRSKHLSQRIIKHLD